MQTFKSDISGKSFPISGRVSAQMVRRHLMTEIKKEHPDFDENCFLSTEELNYYRTQYIQNALENELGELTGLEKQVIETLERGELLTNKLTEEKQETLSYGQKLADKVASFGGSWTFITFFGLFLFCWMILNAIILATHSFDPYPFILLNLILSCIAALQAPVIMMSQNRQEQKDRDRAKNDYMINLKSELEIRLLHDKIDHLINNQQEKLMEIQQIQIDMMNDILNRLENRKRV
jgi:uncharacterized membrane protein